MKTLRQVNIEGFKSIAKQTLDLGDLNVVIGPNGSGKSNLIGVFRLLDRVLSRNLQLYVAEQGGADRFLHHGQKHTPAMEVNFDFAQNAYGFRLKPALGDSLVLKRNLWLITGAGITPRLSPKVIPKASLSRLPRRAKPGTRVCLSPDRELGRISLSRHVGFRA